MRSFVVRLWTPADEVEGWRDEPELRGVVEPVGSNEATPFRNDTELLRLLRGRLRARTGTNEEEGEGRR